MKTIEQRYADLLRGSEDNSPLVTDGYKMPMAQGGFPLRWERFYLHFRKGGPLFIPFDFKAVLEALRPRLPDARERGFLVAHGYGYTPAMDAALQGDMDIYAQPKGTWSCPQEPLVSIGAPSFLASWPEALAIAFNFPMQVATAMKRRHRMVFDVNCHDEGEIIKLVAEALGYPEPTINVKEAEFRRNVEVQVEKMSEALGGDIDRAFEVGTRSMTCLQHHRIVLEVLKKAGIQRTANVMLAYELYMIPVGTTGHEHQMRHGEIAGFRSIRDQRPEPPSYLFDTYDPIRSGIPGAVDVMLEDRLRRCSVRFDSGDQEAQLTLFVEKERYEIAPLYLFMDGYDDVRTSRMETFAEGLGVAKDRRHYGLGEFFSAKASVHPFVRSIPAMVYKLSMTGGPGNQYGSHGRPVRKYSGTKGKSSLAGNLITLHQEGGVRIIAQQGENLLDTVPAPTEFPPKPPILSPATQRLATMCRERDLGSFVEPGRYQDEAR